MSYLFALIVVLLGLVLVIKSEWFMNNFGRIAWAEEHLGGGGSRLMYKLIGLVFIFGAIFAVTGIMEDIVVGIFGGIVPN